MAELLLLTRVLPAGGGGAGAAAPPPPAPRKGGGLWGEPLALGLLVAGALLVAMAKGPSAGRARAALALAIVASIVSFLALGLQLMLLPHSCPWCHDLGPAAQGALLGTHVLLMTSSLAGAVLAVIGCVAATRARPRAGPAPVVIYQTALPAQGAGPAEATPPAPQ
ncbi:uncharacterized protein LOC130262859 isoform X2 [Oenanthe melanoleuca]|uniref:uncharacterized protein LOC130262859 isoform X2 n=1 Tax=Oenanthe melanoleuca TaxID=2939378 RepID=UPI0024C16317|nr:uncharacterized protein LOC130262859 isoform X2 [Oenanthe melanoleuca]